MTRRLILVGLIVVAGCSRAAPIYYTWSHDPAALVVDYHALPGYVAPQTYFRCQLYGCRYLRLMGDGRLVYGSGLEASQRRLGAEEVQDLLQLIRPDLLRAVRECQEPIADISATVLGIEVDNFPGFKIVEECLPEDPVVDAASKILDCMKQGGTPVVPASLRVSAAAIDVQQRFKLGNVPQARTWPLPQYDLSKLSTRGATSVVIDFDMDLALRISLQPELDLLRPWLPTAEDYNVLDYPSRPELLFRQGETYYAVAHTIELP